MPRLSDPCPVAVGRRVRVTGIQPNDPDPLPVGSTGTVNGGNGQQIWVRWDNGRSLILLTDDPYEVLAERVCHKCGAVIHFIQQAADTDPLLRSGDWLDDNGTSECRETNGDHTP